MRRPEHQRSLTETVDFIAALFPDLNRLYIFSVVESELERGNVYVAETTQLPVRPIAVLHPVTSIA
jgi:hypothetical protein